MKELFGISMDLIMYVLVALLAASLASIAFVALRNRMMFKMGLRNIPRRRAQTTLIVIGLMLSTVIISAAFTTGDTVDRSITSEIYQVLGSLDETVQLNDLDSGDGFDTSQAGVRQGNFAAQDVAPLLQSLRSDPRLDYVVPAYSDFAVAVNPDKRLSSPLFNVLGLDPEAARGLPDIESTSGERLSLDDLGPNQIYVDESAAEALDMAAGDALQVLVFGKPTGFQVKAIVKDRRLAGSAGVSVRREGGVLPLAVAQQLFDAPGRLTMVALSNRGDARAGVKLSDAVEADLNSRLQAISAASGSEFFVQTIKKSGVDLAEAGGNLLATFFLVFGLFSIGAGILLIFLIFVMLAAERKSEMGMARAVGLKRGDLVQTFLAEGMAYNVLSAMVGVGLGVLVAVLVSRVMAGIFGSENLDISPHITARSLIISYSLGVVLTFFTVTFSSWRVSFLNIVRAIRDIPEPPTPRPVWRRRGFLSTLGRLLFKPGGLRSWAARIGLVVAGVICQIAAAGAGSTVVTVLLGILGGLLFVAGLFLIFQMGFVFIAGSVPLIIVGASADSAFALLFGLSLLPLGIALTVRSFGANERLTYTLTGLVLLYVWEFDFSVGLIDRIFGKTNGNVEMFFLSGVMITVAATFLMVYNADMILAVLTRVGKSLGALLPSMKMAVAYPLANRSRTGMTMAMFCLVVFALTVMTSMNHNFNRLFLSDRSLGGWDISVDENPTNPIPDLKAALSAAGSGAVSQIAAVGTAERAARSRGRVCQPTASDSCRLSSLGGDFTNYPVWGEDPAFLREGRIPLQARSTGYDSDAAVWQAVASDPSLAVADANALGGGFSEGFLKGIDEGATSIDPISVTVADRTTGKSGTVTIIGIIEVGASNTYGALHVSQASFQDIFGSPDVRSFFVRTTPGTNNVEAAREIESSLLTTGAQADSLRKLANDQSATFRSFFLLLQGFMGLGLFVGVAAVGVIAFRTVVERRQQIGMLRAIGYTRNMIGLTFLLESSFIAFLGVVSGIVFALILARQLVHQQFANQGVTTFSVPWLSVLVIGAAAFGFALLMTLIPSRQAANVPIAQALRYE